MLDHVHDIQQTYRRLVTALARPGSIVELADIAVKVTPRPPFNPTMMLLAYTLLDAETEFALATDSEGEADAAEVIANLTYARPVLPEDAGYLFILGVQTDPRSTIEAARVGTLVDPHRGATLFLEVERVLAVEDAPFVLEGPGIDGSIGVDIESRYDWYSIRNEKVSEYPLGVDCIFVDREGRVLGLPRTTRVARVEGGKWVT